MTVRVKPAQKARIGRNPATSEAIPVAAKSANVDASARPLAKARPPGPPRVRHRLLVAPSRPRSDDRGCSISGSRRG